MGCCFGLPSGCGWLAASFGCVPFVFASSAFFGLGVSCRVGCLLRLFWGCSWLLLFLGLCPCLSRSFLRAVLFLLVVLVLLLLLFLFRLRSVRLAVLSLVWLGVLVRLALGPLFLVVRLLSFLLVLVPWWFGSLVVLRLRVWLVLFPRLLICSRWLSPLVLPFRLVRWCSLVLPCLLVRLVLRLATSVVWLLRLLRLLLSWVCSPRLRLGSLLPAFGWLGGLLGSASFLGVVP